MTRLEQQEMEEFFSHFPIWCTFLDATQIPDDGAEEGQGRGAIHEWRGSTGERRHGGHRLALSPHLPFP